MGILSVLTIDGSIYIQKNGTKKLFKLDEHKKGKEFEVPISEPLIFGRGIETLNDDIIEHDLDIDLFHGPMDFMCRCILNFDVMIEEMKKGHSFIFKHDEQTQEIIGILPS